MANALQNPQRDDHTLCDRSTPEERLAEIESIARVTESQLRTWGWLRSLSENSGGQQVDAIIYPSTMAGAASLIHRLERSAIDWQAVGRLEPRRSRTARGAVAISLRLLDEHLLFDGERIRVHAGYSVSALAFAASERGLSGLEPFRLSSGSLGDILPPARRSELWQLVEEVVVASHGALRILPTSGGDLTSEQRTTIEGSLILAVTLRLGRRGERAHAKHNGQAKGRVPDSEPPAEDTNRALERDVEGEVIPLSERIRDRAARELQLELEYDVNVWRDESEEG